MIHLKCTVLGVGDGQGGLLCCNPWGLKESDTTEGLNWTELQRQRVPGLGLASLQGAVWNCRILGAILGLMGEQIHRCISFPILD